MAAVLSFLCTFAILSTCTSTTTTTTTTPQSVDTTFSTITHLACTCQDGYYKQASVVVYAPQGVCGSNLTSAQQTSLSWQMSLATLGQSSGSGKNYILQPVSFLVCQSCVRGCLECSGPDAKHCSACKKDFFLLLDHASNGQSTRSIRSSDQKNQALDGASKAVRPGCSGNSSDSTQTNSNNSSSCHQEGLQISLTLNETKNDPDLDTVMSQEELLYSTPTTQSPTTTPNLMTTFDDASGESAEVTLNSTLKVGSGPNNVNCVSRCPLGMFGDEKDMTCKYCHPECDGCEDLGANRCLRCRNLVLGDICVANCPDGYKVGDADVCQKQEEAVSGVPSSFYIITPLVAIMIVVMCVIMVSVHRRKCTSLSVRLVRGFRAEDRHGHTGHQKCYLKKARLPEFLALKTFQGEEAKMGSVNVYIDNPLTRKASDTFGKYSSHPHIDVDRDDDDYDDDEDYDGPLYETPGRGSPASSYKGYKVAANDAKHYLTPCSIGTLDSRKNFTLGSGCSCKSVESIRSFNSNNKSSRNIEITVGDDEETPPISDDSTIKSGICEGIKWEICNELKHMEVPFFPAPPLPERNSQSAVKPLEQDPIYSNIDDEVL